jgi:hypothetical protein
MTERQKFTIVKDYSTFQLRNYEPCVIAEVVIEADYSSAASRAFQPLFRYISKGNEKAQGISMTAPVISESTEGVDSNQWKVSFVMPAGSTIADMPNPVDSKVELRALGEEKCAAISFRGRATNGACAKKIEELRAAAAKEGLGLSHETRICRFDPPFKPGFMHYNEIVIPLA